MPLCSQPRKPGPSGRSCPSRVGDGGGNRRAVAGFGTAATVFALALLVPILGGCGSSNPMLAKGPVNGWPNGGAAPAPNPAGEWDRRASALDADNRDLHAELAKSQQQVQLLNDKIRLLSQQLSDTAGQLQSAQVAKQEAEKRADTIQASTRLRSGATITANNSVTRSLDLINIPGVEVRRDQDVIRIELPADRLFAPGTAQLQSSAPYLLDQVADALIRSYPRQMIGIESHTEASAAAAATMQQLSSQQAQAVYAALLSRSRIPATQLFTASHGANHPLASNGTPSGRARNRRIEIVVYPDVVGQR